MSEVAEAENESVETGAPPVEAPVTEPAVLPPIIRKADRPPLDPERAKLYARPRIPKPRVWPLFTIAFAVVVLDQWLKWWIRFNINSPGETLPLWPGVVHLSNVWNYGAAWGVFAGARWALVACTLAVCCAITFFCRRISATGKLSLLTAGLILGGAVGNLIDRLRFGYVLDMIDMDTPIGFINTFPVFNIADSALTVGVIILLILSFVKKDEVPEKLTTERAEKE